jgi:hypothetical protein
VTARSFWLRNTGSETAVWVSVIGPGDKAPLPSVADIASLRDPASMATVTGGLCKVASRPDGTEPIAWAAITMTLEHSAPVSSRRVSPVKSCVVKGVTCRAT